MLHSIRQFIEALQDPYGLTRTLGEIEVCRSSDGEPLRWSATARWFSKSAAAAGTKCSNATHGLWSISKRSIKRNSCGKSFTFGRPTGRASGGGRGHRRLDRRDHALRSRYAGRRLRRQSAPQQLGPTVRPPGAGTSRKRLGARGPEPENILLDESGTLRPVDFDAMFLPVFAGEKSPELGTAATSTPDARRRISTRRSTTTPSPRSPRPRTRWRSSPDCSPATTGERDCCSRPGKSVRHGCAAHAECLALFEKAGDASAIASPGCSNPR